jgi:hypothetical protein
MNGANNIKGNIRNERHGLEIDERDKLRPLRDIVPLADIS